MTVSLDADYRQKLLDRFLRYVKVDTRSDEASESSPSTEKQKDLSRMLAEEDPQIQRALELFDEAADLIGELEVEDSEQVLHHISEEDEEVLRTLLEYPEDTAGGIMNPEVVALTPDATVDDAISYLRSADQDTVTAAMYVVDSSGGLLGFVRLRRLVTARSAPAHKRVVLTLREWGIRIDEALFLGGKDKGEFLKAFGADIFFDDQQVHIESARKHVATAHVPHGVTNAVK